MSSGWESSNCQFKLKMAQLFTAVSLQLYTRVSVRTETEKSLSPSAKRAVSGAGRDVLPPYIYPWAATFQTKCLKRDQLFLSSFMLHCSCILL